MVDRYMKFLRNYWDIGILLRDGLRDKASQKYQIVKG